ncbi:MAG: pyruvate ferredoxin oxidoreductase [SAR324 cluster bacterium]|nr:pyruvate ferredoxin oxidoreductase [SAR324 cluster bacterium]MBL7036053.1 pyruvate ferredoxin oxidoreductase [SAR324 cluster bacterium]
MKKVLMGNHAASWGARLSRVQMIAAYPITPQTHIVEELAEMCGDGSLKAKFLKVESEHSAMASVIAAESAGVRSFTASSSNGLALMHELLHWAAGARLPIVMVNVNRALAPGWNIWADQSDSLSQRDTGWIQFYVEDNQEVLDSVIMAYRLAEQVNLPVMICYDAFYLSHTYEPVDIPRQETVDEWLPSYEPDCFLDTKNPSAFNGLVMPSHFMEMRYKLQEAHEETLNIVDEICESFGKQFGRCYGAIETVHCEDAELVLITSSSATSPARLVVESLRDQGMKVGLMKVRMFRPFPYKFIRKVLRGKNKAVVVDRNFSWGKSGIFAAEIRDALANEKDVPDIYSFIAGLGGKSITPELLTSMVIEAAENPLPESPSVWKGMQT